MLWCLRMEDQFDGVCFGILYCIYSRFVCFVCDQGRGLGCFVVGSGGLFWLFGLFGIMKEGGEFRSFDILRIYLVFEDMGTVNVVGV